MTPLCLKKNPIKNSPSILITWLTWGTWNAGSPAANNFVTCSVAAVGPRTWMFKEIFFWMDAQSHIMTSPTHSTTKSTTSSISSPSYSSISSNSSSTSSNSLSTSPNSFPSSKSVCFHLFKASFLRTYRPSSWSWSSLSEKKPGMITKGIAGTRSPIPPRTESSRMDKRKKSGLRTFRLAISSKSMQKKEYQLMLWF